MACCLKKFGNTSLLDKEVQEDLGRVGELDGIPLGPEKVIRLATEEDKMLGWKTVKGRD